MGERRHQHINTSLYLYCFSVVKMGKMNIVLEDDLEEKFRRAVFERLGMKKGNISEALKEALEQWIEGEQKGERKLVKH